MTRIRRAIPRAGWFAACCLAVGCSDDTPAERDLIEVESRTYSTMWNDDPVDIHHPTSGSDHPVALFLQGGKVDKAEYATFGAELASHGFVVVIPNHHHVIDFPGFRSEGYYAVQEQIATVMEFVRDEAAASDSPLHGRVDTDALVLLGHSYGAAVEISALQGRCAFPFCPEDGAFEVPPELAAVAGLGINMLPKVGTPEIPETDNEGVPLAIINGRIDSNAREAETITSYDRILHAPKALVFIEGGNHYVMCDRDNPEGPSPDPAAPTLDQREGIELAAEVSAMWLWAAGFDHPQARERLESWTDPRLDIRLAL